MKVSIMSIITNKSRLENISGRDFIVADGMAAHGDSAMNGVFYPASVISNKAKSLEGKPTPLSHPKRDGMNVSADDFFSNGAYNIGGKVLVSEMSGQKNIVKIYVDKEFAERSEQGKKLVNRLMNGEYVGLSTGLVPLSTREESGVDQFGMEYNQVIEDLEYDHLAFLLDEMPAGIAAGTKVIINAETGESLDIITHSGGKSDHKKVEVNAMEHKIDLSDLSKSDRVKIVACNAQDILAAITAEPKQATVEQAQEILEAKGLKINSAESVVLTKEAHESLKANADLYANAEKARVDIIKAAIMANSKLEDADLSGMSEESLSRFSNSLTPQNDFSLNDTVTTNADADKTFKPLEGM